MATITIRPLDEHVLDGLKQRASWNNRSLEDEARHILESTVDECVTTKCAEFLRAIERLRPLTEGRRHTPAEVLIREDRDLGHHDRL